MAATDFLTEARIRRARAKERPYKLRDGGGLYLLITPTDAKQWRLRYVIGGRESMLSLGGNHCNLLSSRDNAAEGSFEFPLRSDDFGHANKFNVRKLSTESRLVSARSLVLSGSTQMHEPRGR